MSKQVYVLCDFGAPRAVFTRRDNAEAMVAEFGCGIKYRRFDVKEVDRWIEEGSL